MIIFKMQKTLLQYKTLIMNQTHHASKNGAFQVNFKINK